MSAKCTLKTCCFVSSAARLLRPTGAGVVMGEGWGAISFVSQKKTSSSYCPFVDGNGRTSRILSFFVLSVKLGFVLPGTPTFPELVIAHRHAYEDALDLADDACKQGRIDVSAMEALIESLLAKQLAHVYELAGGQAPDFS
jgi:hypothetical protein